MPLNKEVFMAICQRNNIPSLEASKLYKFACLKKRAEGVSVGGVKMKTKKKLKKTPKVETPKYTHEKIGEMAYGVGFQDAIKMFKISRKASE